MSNKLWLISVGLVNKSSGEMIDTIMLTEFGPAPLAVYYKQQEQEEDEPYKLVRIYSAYPVPAGDLTDEEIELLNLDL